MDALGLLFGTSWPLLGVAYNDFVTKVLDEVEEKQMYDAFKEHGMMFKGKLNPGDLLVLPAGSVVVQRALGDVPCYGWRAPVYQKSEPCKKVLQTMHDQLMAAQGDGALVRFWKSVLDQLR